jgi:hypothetical protein
MSTSRTMNTAPPATPLEVRERHVAALKIDLVGPGAGHALAEERLRGWERPSNWYLTGFLIPTGTAPEKRADADADEDFELVPESAGLAEESNEERKAAKKAYFPSSMGLSFLAAREARELAVTVRWGDYVPLEIEGGDGKPIVEDAAGLAFLKRKPKVAERLAGFSDEEVLAAQGVTDERSRSKPSVSVGAGPSVYPRSIRGAIDAGSKAGHLRCNLNMESTWSRR